MSKLQILGIALIIISILGGAVFEVSARYTSYQYNKLIGSHIDNAYEVNTPDKMAEEINLAILGMKQSGLTESDYGAMIFKTSSNSMQFQYNYLNSVLERIQAVQEWNEKVKSDPKATESLGDVYEQKMDNLRQFLKEGGSSDWIAKDAWYVKYHPILYFEGTLTMLISILIILGIVCIKYHLLRRWSLNTID